MTKKELTIIIPTLNSDKVLQKCLKSIQSQDYPKKLLQIGRICFIERRKEWGAKITSGKH